jgi:hypothetical protein
MHGPPTEAVTGSQLIRGNLHGPPNEGSALGRGDADRYLGGRAGIAKMHPDHMKPSRIIFVALVAQMLCACSQSNGSAARYPDLNAPPPSREFLG